MTAAHDRPNSISVVENFYGEQLSADLIRKIRDTPFEQLVELADGLVRYNRTLETAFAARTSGLGSSVGPRFQSFRTDQIFCWDDLYIHGGEGSALAESRSLKHAILYTDRLVLPDFSLDWAEETMFNVEISDMGYPYKPKTLGAGLARALGQLLPIAPLVRAGTVVLAASCENFDIYNDGWDQRYSLNFRCNLKDRTITRIFWEDPYLAWWVMNSAVLVQPWELEALDLHRPEDFQEAASYFLRRHDDDEDFQARLDNLFVKAYGPNVSITAARDAVILNRAYREANLTPVTGATTSMMHLVRSAKVALDGLSAKDVGHYDAISAATRFSIPPMANVPLDDLVRLRLQEDVYYEVRDCLVALADRLADTPTPGSYGAYEKSMKTEAEAIVRPVFQKLDDSRRKARLAALVSGYGAGYAVTIALSGLATFVSGFAPSAARSAARGTGKAVNNYVQKRVNGKQQELTTACSLLVSVLDGSR